MTIDPNEAKQIADAYTAARAPDRRMRSSTQRKEGSSSIAANGGLASQKMAANRAATRVTGVKNMWEIVLGAFVAPQNPVSRKQRPTVAETRSNGARGSARGRHNDGGWTAE
jgi:hypothetical protein